MSQRGREIIIARNVTDRLFAVVMRTSKEPSLAVFAHAFGTVCCEQDFFPDDASYRRITADILSAIGERRRAAHKLNKALVRSTAELRHAAKSRT